MIIKNILKELDKIPLIYLQNIYQIVRTFRKHLPIIPIKEQQKAFDWDELIDNVHTNRQRNNERMAKNIDNITW